MSARHRQVRIEIRDVERDGEYLIVLIAAYNAVLSDPGLGSSEPSAMRVLAKRRDELDVELWLSRARATMLRKQLAAMPKSLTQR